MRGATKRITTQEEATAFSGILGVDVRISDVLCQRCRFRKPIGNAREPVGDSEDSAREEFGDFSRGELQELPEGEFEGSFSAELEGSPSGEFEDFVVEEETATSGASGKPEPVKLFSINWTRTAFSHQRCLVCKATGTNHVVNLDMSRMVFDKVGVFIP